MPRAAGRIRRGWRCARRSRRGVAPAGGRRLTAFGVASLDRRNGRFKVPLRHDTSRCRARRLYELEDLLTYVSFGSGDTGAQKKERPDRRLCALGRLPWAGRRETLETPGLKRAAAA